MIMNLTDCQVAWLAGLMDGEGCFWIRRNIVNNNGWKTLRYEVGVKLTMCHEETVRKVRALVGYGHFSEIKKKEGARASTAYTWLTLGANTCGNFIRAVRPYSVTKAAEMDVVLRFLDINRTPPSDGNMVPVETIYAQDDLYWELRKLKSVWKWKRVKDLRTAGEILSALGQRIHAVNPANIANWSPEKMEKARSITHAKLRRNEYVLVKGDEFIVTDQIPALCHERGWSRTSFLNQVRELGHFKGWEVTKVEKD